MKRVRAIDYYPKQEVDIADAVGRYVELFLAEYGRYPIPLYQIKLLKRSAPASHYYQLFDRIVGFVKSQIKENKAYNPILSVLTDYYRSVINYYKRFNRAPTIKQISPSPTNVSNFISFIIHEEKENEIPYWIGEEDFSAAQRLLSTGGTDFRDPIIEAGRQLIK